MLDDVTKVAPPDEVDKIKFAGDDDSRAAFEEATGQTDTASEPKTEETERLEEFAKEEVSNVDTVEGNEPTQSVSDDQPSELAADRGGDAPEEAAGTSAADGNGADPATGAAKGRTLTPAEQELYEQLMGAEPVEATFKINRNLGGCHFEIADHITQETLRLIRDTVQRHITEEEPIERSDMSYGDIIVAEAARAAQKGTLAHISMSTKDGFTMSHDTFGDEGLEQEASLD